MIDQYDIDIDMPILKVKLILQKDNLIVQSYNFIIFRFSINTAVSICGLEKILNGVIYKRLKLIYARSPWAMPNT